MQEWKNKNLYERLRVLPDAFLKSNVCFQRFSSAILHYGVKLKFKARTLLLKQ